MANKKFFQLSDTAKEVTGFFINPDCFLRLYKENLEIEWNSTLYHYLFDNVPYAFKDIPLLYNNIKQYLAVRLNIHVYDVHLVGSAQLGFSLSPPNMARHILIKVIWIWLLSMKGCLMQLLKKPQGGATTIKMGM